MSSNVTSEINNALRLILERFGVVDIDPTDTWQINRALEERGANIYLLTTIGSWRDTCSDEETLRDLLAWLEDPASLKPESFL